jgi:hypothetical protein
MKARIAALSATALLVAAFPAGATASSVIDQYIEQVPGAGGKKPPASPQGGSGSGGGSGFGTALPAGVLSGLSAQGGERGELAARTLDRTAETDRERRSGRDGPPGSLDATTANPRIGETVASLVGGNRGGLGLFLPAILLGSLAALGLVAWRRRESGAGLGA